jgi:hypothetical protein
MVFAIASELAFSQEPRYLLDVEGATPGKEIVVSRPPNGLFPIHVILNVAPPVQVAGQPAATPKLVQVTMSQFAGDRGSFAVPILACDSQKAVQSLDFTLAAVQTICLWIPALPGDGRYTGSMLFFSEDAKPLVKPFVITRPQAVLIVQPIPTQPVTLPIWGRFAKYKSSGSSPEPQQTFHVMLSEKSGAASADGIMVGLTVSKSPSGFDLKKNIAFRINAKDVPDLDSGPPTDDTQMRSRTVPAGGQLGIDVSLYGLKPGEYDAVLRFSSPNSLPDDSQKQNLVVQVRDSIVWAVIWLVVAVCVSFIATKVLVGLRWRANLQRQIHDLTPQWFAGLPHIFAVAWVRAVLHQANRLGSRFWLTSTNLIDDQVNSVRGVLKILDQAHQLQGLLTRALDDFLLRRVLIDLDELESRLEAGAPDDAAVTRIQTELKAFEDWIAKDKSLAKFQSDVIPDINKLLREISSGRIPPAGQPTINDLIRIIQTALKSLPQNTEEMNELYRNYAQLRVLWIWRNDPAELTDELAAYPDLKEVLRIADLREWKRLKDPETKLKIRLPDNETSDGLEAYVPLRFSVEPNDPQHPDLPELAQSYLFRHKIECAWTFTLTPARRGLERIHLWRLTLESGRPRLEPVYLRQQPQPITRSLVSMGPSAVHYFPRGGRAEVQVQLRYEGENTSDVQQEIPPIQDSSDFGFFSAFEKAEVMGWLIAAGAAIATGLSTFYFKGPVFGSFQDYLTLFVWGAGIDQTKTFVQNIQASSPPPSQAH